MAAPAHSGNTPSVGVYTELEKHRLCELLAQFHTPKAVQEQMAQETGKTVSIKTIYDYLHAKRWRPLIDRCRQEWAAGVMELPFAHKRKRVEELTKLYDQVEHDDFLPALVRVRQQLAILRDLREEMDERTTNFTNIFFASMQNYTDEELIRRRDEVLARINELRTLGGVNGQRHERQEPLEADIVDAELRGGGPGERFDGPGDGEGAESVAPAQGASEGGRVEAL